MRKSTISILLTSLLLTVSGTSLTLASCTVISPVARTIETSVGTIISETYSISAKELPTQTATPTPEPSETQTDSFDSLNVDNYQIVDGNIEEMRGGVWQKETIPYEAGSIAYVEVHDGKMHGIDTADRAVVVKDDSGEWVKFERPVFGADFDNFTYDDGEITTISKIDSTGLNLNEINIEDIERMYDIGGNIVEWGSVMDGYSGYFIGIVHTSAVYKNDKTGRTVETPGFGMMYVFEIPHKYDRQIILINNADLPDESYSTSFIDKKGNVVYSTVFSPLQLDDFLTKNMISLRGQQCVITLSMKNDSEILNALSQNQGKEMYTTFAFYDKMKFDSKFAPK